MTINLKDVELLGIRVHEDAVTVNYDDEEDIVRVREDLLGLHLSSRCKYYIQIKEMKQSLLKKPFTTEQQVRTFILCTFDIFLFRTTNKGNVSLLSLPLRNLQQGAQSRGSIVFMAPYLR